MYCICLCFQVYWQLGKDGAVIPPSWPRELQTAYNIDHQMSIMLNGVAISTYLSVSMHVHAKTYMHIYLCTYCTHNYSTSR